MTCDIVACKSPRQKGGAQPARTCSPCGTRSPGKLSRYLVKPEVTVQLSEVKSRRTMVLGEVNSPGSFVLDTEQTALDALSKAGGAKSDANFNPVLLVRNAGGSKKDEIYLNLNQAKDYSANVALQNGDILYVPANMSTWLTLATRMARQTGRD